MKRLIVFLLLLSLLSFSPLFATPFSAYLPGGKNYLDVDNLFIDEDSMVNYDPIRVRPETTYVIQFPPLGMFDFPYLTISSDGTDLIDGYAHESSQCENNGEMTYCTFTTTSAEYINLTLSAQGLSQYVSYYGIDGIQLEEGSTPTEYEPYVSPFIDVNSPEFQGSATFVKAYYETITIATIIDQHILVIDDIDGDITNSIVVTNDTYTANMNAVGQYTATLTATDTSGNSSSMDLTILVKDEVSPEIQGPDTVIVNVDSPPILADLLTANYVAVDGHDGNVSLSVEQDGYTGNTTMLGTYPVSLKAIDASGNTTTKMIDVIVEDQTSPIMINDENIVIQMSNPKSLATILSELSLSDNYADPSQLNIVVLNDAYTGNEDTPGDYSVNIIVSDPSNNSIQEQLYVHLLDDVAPVISGPETISVSYLNAPTMADLLAQLSVMDNVTQLDVNDLVIQTNTYVNRETSTGSFHVVYQTVDAAGNESLHDITITLLDDQAPIIYIDNYLVTVTSEATFHAMDALQMMMENEELPQDTYEIVTVRDDYTGNETTPGTYEYHLKFIDSQGVSYDKEFMIRVADQDVEPPTFVEQVRPILVYLTTAAVVIYILYRSKK